jgi:carbonic anhydrase
VSTTDELLRNNEAYAASFDMGDLPMPPRRKLAVVACMDARLNPCAILGLKPTWAAEAFADLDEDVRQSIARVKASPFIPRKESVRGFVYEVETGRLREVV